MNIKDDLELRKSLAIVSQCPLFNGIDQDDLMHILNCLQVSIKEYSSDDYVFFAGDTVDSIGVVLKGSVEIVKESFAGTRHIIAILGPSHMFGEGIVCTKKRNAPVTVHVKNNASIILIPYERILQKCSNACIFHQQLIFNMMLLLGEKNYTLNHKIDLLMIKGIKEKLASYLLYESARQASISFEISMNRNQLAEYLNISRPSMSRELSFLKEEGIIDYDKNHFSILDWEGLKAYADM